MTSTNKESLKKQAKRIYRACKQYNKKSGGLSQDEAKILLRKVCEDNNVRRNLIYEILGLEFHDSSISINKKNHPCKYGIIKHIKQGRTSLEISRIYPVTRQTVDNYKRAISLSI